MPYEGTNVTVGKTQEQIKTLLGKNKVTVVRFTSFPAFALLEFARKVDTGALIPYQVRLIPKGSGGTIAGLERAERQVWRVCYWWLKAKFEAINFGLVEFEQEMLPYMLIQGSDGQSEPMAKVFFEHLAGKLAAPVDPFGGMRPALPSGTEPRIASMEVAPC